MRILHVISSPASGGAEVYVKDLVLEMKAKGYYVAIAFLNRAIEVGRSQEYEDQFLSELQVADIPYFFIGYEARKKPWLGVLRVRKYVKDNNINIYHSHLPYGVVFAALLRVPCIYTHHTITARLNKFQYFIFNKIVDCYIGISKKCTEKLTEYTGRSVITIRNGVSFSKIYKKEFLRNRDIVNAISVGRIQPQKNYFGMVDIVSMLPEKILSKFQLKIAGEGPDKDKLLEYIESKELSNIIKLLGNRSDIPELLARSDVFLMSSELEGLPIALIEAAATGLPCLVTDVGGCSEVIEGCENGFYIKVDDFEGYLEKLIKLISDKELRNKLSQSALEKSHVFSIENSANEHLALYNKVLREID